MFFLHKETTGVFDNLFGLEVHGTVLV